MEKGGEIKPSGEARCAATDGAMALVLAEGGGRNGNFCLDDLGIEVHEFGGEVEEVGGVLEGG